MTLVSFPFFPLPPKPNGISSLFAIRQNVNRFMRYNHDMNVGTHISFLNEPEEKETHRWYVPGTRVILVDLVPSFTQLAIKTC